jgi:2-(1,2-epoxy-1,2-dihydrophenyl)acetyl-CoA isomerase
MTTTTLETIIVTRNAGVVTVTLNRPRRKNAISGQMWDELLVTFRDIASRGDDRVVVLTGADGDFCSGADLSGTDTARHRHQLAAMRHVGDVCLALHRLPQPSIAKVRGVAVGAGLNMALACDLVVAAADARFSEIFARRGLSVDFGGSWILPRRIGMHRAKELVLLADIIDAAEAERIGLVNRVLPGDELDAFVDGWAARLAAGPPIALAQSKRLLDNSLGVTLEQALDDEGAAQTVNFATRDTLEAMQAFIDKRQPTFEGR